MEIEHFKGVKSRKLDFSFYTEICGENGTGKSTINEAYMWCIFGKNPQGNVVSITPKDEENRIIPKVESSVRIIVNVDGIDYSIERKQKQKWATNKNGDEIFGGYSTERYINDVPCGVSEFNNKLNEICKLEDWFMLSSIYAFMGLKQEERRKILIQLAGEINEEELLKKYPDLESIIANTKLSINDIQAQRRLSLKKVETELSEIPARIDECYKLIKEYDFDIIEDTIKDIENQIVILRKEKDKVQANGIITKIENLGNMLMSIDKQIDEIKDSLFRERRKKESDVILKIRQAESDLMIAQSVLKSKNKSLEDLNKSLSNSEAKIVDLRNNWTIENGKVFNAEINSVCPTCHRPFDNSNNDYVKSLEDAFYTSKKEILKSIEAEAGLINSKIISIREEIKQVSEEVENIQSQSVIIEGNIKKFNEELQAIPTLEHALSAHQERLKLLEQKESIAQEVKRIQGSSDADETEKMISQLNEALEQQASLLKAHQEKLLQRTINCNTKKRINELEETSKSLTQDKVDCKHILSQIDMYKKDKINIVNDKVSGLFEIVKWKMYEQNVSNDGEKEICQAIVFGVPYEEQNTATKVNASVDIINGLSKALNLSLPLFIDNKESVTNKISSNSQIIALEVQKGQKMITIKTY